jgi:signal peptidase I
MKNQKLQQQIRYWWREWIKPMGVILIIVSTVRSALADWNDVPTGSMKPTILEGDRIWVNKLAYDLKLPFTTRHLAEWGNPSRGEIIVCFSPYDGQRLVKRVVGLPGDRIEMANNRLTINGQPAAYQLTELDPSAFEASGAEPRPRCVREQLDTVSHLTWRLPATVKAATFGPLTVPEGQYFLMGDNRDVSFDSRYFGCVPRRQIIGRASAVVASVDPSHYYRPRLARWLTALR